ncbi:hypothetical protein AB1L42_23640 [Thalassoglobus sp. JC818]|uniref:AbiU2 domain-containing protein n=1 Tax=Thalassoglobus sp. JC818 TaxID=3232136 RepID=UPI0034585027
MSLRPDDFEIIHNEVRLICETWNLVLDLFKEDEDIEVLDQSGSTAWALIGNALLDSILLSLTRLVDNNKKTMRLQRIVSASSDANLRQKLEFQLNEFEWKAAPFIKHRNRRVAHRNQKVARGESVLPMISFDDFESLLGDLRQLMNTVYQSREDSVFAYDLTSRIGDGREVLNCLRNGLRLSALREAAWDGSRTEKELLAELRKYPSAG